MKWNLYFWVRNALSILAGINKNGWRRPTMVLVCASSTLSLTKFVPFTSHTSTTPFGSSFLSNRDTNVSVAVPLFVCHAKKKIGFFDQILDYIEGTWSILFSTYSFFFFIIVLIIKFQFLCFSISGS